MRNIKTSLTQTILNKCNSKKEFTHILNEYTGRYIVSSKNIYTGNNPSIKTDLNKEIYSILKEKRKSTFLYDSIGLWINPKNNIIYIDANIHFFNLDNAIELAKLNNQLAIYDLKTKKVINLK